MTARKTPSSIQLQPLESKDSVQSSDQGFIDELVEQTFRSYPDSIRWQLLRLRQLILETARRTEGIGEVKETLKWGQPSYLVRGGSTIRVGKSGPDSDRVAIYFHCQTSLVETFKELYGNTFRYEGHRAMVFGVDAEIPTEALSHCISIALRYHRLKHLPLLGQ